MLATYPSMSECYYMMGRVYEKMEEHTTAILVIEKAVSLVKRGNRLEVNIIDLFTSLYDNYVALSPPDHHGGMRALEGQVQLFMRDRLHRSPETLCTALMSAAMRRCGGVPQDDMTVCCTLFKRRKSRKRETETHEGASSFN